MFNFNRVQNFPSEQLPIIQIVDLDDLILEHSEHAEWYRILKNLPWQPYCAIGADYYTALADFNQKQPNNPAGDGGETPEAAKERFLFGRATMDPMQPTLAPPRYQAAAGRPVLPREIAPGIVPERRGGPKPKDFFALFKSFIGAPFLGFKAEPEEVHRLLTSNPAYARVCGFAPSLDAGIYSSAAAPSLRKLQQFDQIMTEYGLWDQAKQEQVRRNILTGRIQPESILVGDTTHYYANSRFETVRYVDENGEEHRKSQSKPTKACRCEDRLTCGHPWSPTDEGAGTIVKGPEQVIRGHKAAISGLPLQGIPLDAAAVADAATHDGQTLLPHVERLLKQFPEIQPWIGVVLYDRAADDGLLKSAFLKELGIELKSAVNPRRRQALTEGLPKGMDRLSPYGTLTCRGGFRMDDRGARFETERFIYQAPLAEDGHTPVCSGCPHKPWCSPLSTSGRVAAIPFDQLPHIMPDDPPMSKTFQAMMTRRPAVERMIKRLKCDFGDETLSKRGNLCFQAYLDKTLLAFHILLSQ